MQQYHIGLIPDGNRRWARERGLEDYKGHEHGAKILKNAVEWALRKPEIKELSVYVLSEENFKRSEYELNWLNKIYGDGVNELRQNAFVHETGIKINMISTHPAKLDPTLKQIFNLAYFETKLYGNKMLNILIGYTGKKEILQAANTPLNKIKNLLFGLTEEDISKALQVKTPCDFIIRSSQEEAEREAKSGFLIWQSAYSEYYHIKKNWGDVTTEDLNNAWNYFLMTKRLHGQ